MLTAPVGRVALIAGLVIIAGLVRVALVAGLGRVALVTVLLRWVTCIANLLQLFSCSAYHKIDQCHCEMLINDT